MGVEATPLDELGTVVAKHTSSWAENFIKKQEDIQRYVRCLQKMQVCNPWDGTREVLRVYPFFGEIWGTTFPKLYLDAEGYTCKAGTMRAFYGTEEKWGRHNWENLLTSLNHVISLCQRCEKEARVLINFVHRVRSTSELPPTDEEPLEEAQQLLKCIHHGRDPMIPNPFSPETQERLKREKAEKLARKSRKAMEWSFNFDQMLEELKISIPREQERVDQILRANLSSDEAISRCLEEAESIMVPYARPSAPSEEG
jgi:hypothetical protein